MLRKQLAVRGALVASLLALGVGGAEVAHAAVAAPASQAKTCGAGYVRANLSWGVKCLRAGEFCKVGNREYLKFGFYCPATGHLRRR
jgi:hypothetical protein